MVVDADLHADQEKFLLDQGSKQDKLWGINIYPVKPFEEMIEFDSMINLRPTMNNMSRGIDNEKIQKEILRIIKKLIE